MAQVTYRANLSSSSWPFISEFGGRTVIVPQSDQNYVRGLTPNVDGVIDDNDRGIPQVTYLHNVMPSAEGYQSIAYTNQAVALGGGAVVTKILRCQNTSFTIDSLGRAWLLRQLGAGYTWSLLVITGVADLNQSFSIAELGTEVYVHIIGSAEPFRRVDFFLNQLQSLVTTGLPSPLATQGIISSFGYLLTWDTTFKTIYWSSLTNPLDFTPSLVTGAGKGDVLDAKGRINFCAQHQLGFIVYCQFNSVAAMYTGNAKFPFQFRAIKGAGGCDDLSVCATELISESNYTYTTAGLQKISPAVATTIYPDLTDFISGRLMEDFDEGSLSFTVTTSPTRLLVKVAAVEQRYLCISYGIVEYTHALVLDLVNGRWGKLKNTHVQIFQLENDPKQFGSVMDLARGSLALFKSDGSVQTVNFEPSAGGTGVIMLGKYQFIRDRLLTLEQVDFENNRANSGAFVCYDKMSLDGQSLRAPVAGYADSLTTNGLMRYKFHLTGINHSILCVGPFYLKSLILKFHINGRR